ncbi:peptidoglycan-binding protein [Anabaena cylindrica FACHB-243]|uniref:Peptidoglycan-binding domain 1 protein n=1 Tax=Anabaena cylindrica (strain ATCC 27899 / PCC 7122) TaxID=272123 RepID=K9ZNB5_ANACC|nr:MULTISPECIES: peptidoglycan-binding protein [Anabaena]AFZ60057.1 Peptidoglycan-binding domain 1 protein [Anabaena cylindrica PCC 7122]MBD2417887.1 peptidoglycan-binding protein [Anabaena cylindrica FACHB-243]MBY5282532.1 peptidoglycan-binding protein [Anabaena sp. CCAP 1446/1C]MBY5307469.1 peptidoglycan-binding protein [Anabaena sp. CCAP 1446/1C]MCM2404803.1 peptidoglycan-binding protein [Anabaena sp. CCAP 1446/1C]
MNGHLTTSISNYLKPNHLYYLFLCTAIPALIGSSAVRAIASTKRVPDTQQPVGIPVPAKIAQFNTNTINRPTLKLGSQGERVSELQAALKLLGFYTGAIDGIYQAGTASSVSQFKQAAGLNPDGVVDAVTWQKLFPNVSTVATNIPLAPTQPTSVNSFTVPTQSYRIPKINNTPVQKPIPSRQSTTIRNKPNTPFQPTPTKQQNPIIQYTAEGWPILRLGNSGSEVVKLQKLLQNLGFLKGRIDGDFGVTTEAAVKAAQTRYGLQPDGIAGGATWEAFVRRLPQ